MSEKKDYIERRSALEEFDDLIRQTCNKPVPPLKVKRIIENLPAADVVEVVRCKCCQHGRMEINPFDSGKECLYCNYHNGTTDKNDFCFYGEQREGERE